MTVAYFDCFSGASGDMIVGSLLDAGADLERLRADLAVLGLPHVDIGARRLARQGIHATKFDVRVAGHLEGPAEPVEPSHPHGDDPDHPHRHPHGHDHPHAHGHTHPHDHGHDHPHDHGHDHPHDHGHDHPHDHGHDHPHDHGHEHPHRPEDAHAHEAHAHDAHAHHPHGHAHGHDHAHGQESGHEHRTLGDVEAVLQALPEPARGRAIAIFRRLAAAEASVHGTTAAYVHFHEVGMDDAIVDVAAAVLCLQQLGVTEVRSSPLPLGRGMVRCAHGMMPVPVPAVVELVAGVPTFDNGERGELVTPTGAAILTALASSWGPPPAWTLSGVGYGAGGREGERIPNLLRVMLGTLASEDAPASPAGTAGLVEIAANLDDMNPQLYGPLVERLLAEGALDVTVTPTVMKKGRPGVILGVIAPARAREAIARLIFRETTTLGLRWHAIERIELERAFEQVATPWGPVGIKVGRLEGVAVNAMPEFEDCRARAEASGESLKTVWQTALGLARSAMGPGGSLG